MKTVQARLGHKSAMMTLNVYGHLWEDADDQTRAAITTALGGASAADGLRTEARS